MGQRFFASIQKELGDGEFCRAVVPTCTHAVVATATVSTAVHSSALLFTAAFHISRFACDV
jgi:hypothetical protein